MLYPQLHLTDLFLLYELCCLSKAVDLFQVLVFKGRHDFVKLIGIVEWDFIAVEVIWNLNQIVLEQQVKRFLPALLVDGIPCDAPW